MKTQREESMGDMKALWIASMLPSRFNWLAGPWNLRSLVALRDHAGVEVRAICPVGLTPPVSLVGRLPPDSRGLWNWFSRRAGDQGGVDLQGVPVEYPRWIWPPKSLFWRYEGRLLYRQLRAMFGRIVREFRPDVIHAPWLHPEGVAACLVGEEHGVPVVAQGIGNDANYYLHRYPGRRLVIGDLQKAGALLFNCQSTRAMAQKAGLDHPNVHVIYHGVEVEKFTLPLAPPRNEVKRIVTVAQLIPRKNHRLLLRAFAQLPPEVRRAAALEFVGGGPSRPDLERLAAELGIAGQVTFAGRPPHEEMIQRLQQADLFCLPTLSEGMPVATIEAMACGLPVVASAVDGIPEAVVEGVSGLLVPPDDAGALAAALQDALAREWDRRAVRAVVLEKFTWRLYADSVRRLYESLSSRPRS